MTQSNSDKVNFINLRNRKRLKCFEDRKIRKIQDFRNRIKVFMNDQELRQWLQINLKVNPKDLNVYRMAITTRQYEVLEFFGDSVLGFMVSEYLIRKFTVDQPGWFTNVRSQLVEDKILSLIAKKINLISVITIPTTSSREQISDRVMADVLEALIGVIYLDQGFSKCREVITSLFELDRISPPYNTKTVNTETTVVDIENPISVLQELLAKYGNSPPQYIELYKQGSDHLPVFTIRATCKFRGQNLVADGSGREKKEAKRNAAHKLLALVLSL